MRRQPEASVFKYRHRLGVDRSVAWRKLELRTLGPVLRRGPRAGKWLRRLDYRIERIPILNHVLSIFIVMIGWPIFYFPDPKDLKICYLAMIGYHTETAMTLREATPFYQYFFIVIAMFLCCTPIFSVIANAIFPKGKVRTDVAKGIFASFVTAGCFFILLMQSYNPFLYFRF